MRLERKEAQNRFALVSAVHTPQFVQAVNDPATIIMFVIQHFCEWLCQLTRTYVALSGHRKLAHYIDRNVIEFTHDYFHTVSIL